MSAHAYSESYASARRHARNLQRHTTQPAIKKTAEIIPLVPRQFNQEKAIELAYPKYRRLSSSATTLIVVGLHIAAFAFFYFKPEPVQPPKPPAPVIKLEKYTPPVIPPQVVEVQKPQPKKEPPRVIEKPVRADNPNVVEQPIAPPAPAVEAAPAAPEPVTQPSAYAAYLHNPAPVYPEFAQQQGWEGTVVLNVNVFATGKVKEIELKQSSGRKVLDEAALQTVKRWAFVPAMQGTTPIEAWVEVPIDFRLAN